MEKEVREKFDGIDTKFNEVDVRFDAIDKRFEQVDARFDAVDRKFELVYKRFDAVDRKFELVYKRFEQVDRRFEQMLEFIKSESNRIILSINERFVHIDTRISKQALKDEDLEDQMEVLERAIDKDAVAIIDHERRITRLEAA